MVMMYGTNNNNNNNNTIHHIPQVEQVAHLPLTTLFTSSPSPHQHPQIAHGDVTVVRDVEHRPAYNELAVGTNIAKAPRNWLTDDRRLVPVNNRPQDVVSVELPPSVEITNFSDEEVDFIAPAENIKKIFKIPYSSAGVSLVVHKIGRTIVLDKLSKEEAGYFTYQQQPSNSGRFTEIVEEVSPPTSPQKDETYKAKKKNKLKVLENSLYSKFLYYTLLAKEQEKNREEERESFPQSEGSNIPKPAKTFSRLFRWRFRDNIVMIGTDMVIFTHEKQPAVSIRLRDLDKKMSVLTSLDYWLDNVMADVPAVAICNHKNGYVQGYQLIKTEELPRLHPTLSFHPALVEEHASQVFKFLQTNCTQETGTYWLYKGVGDQSLKLYNVSNVRKPPSQAEPAKKERPFALPVGMMCYTLATKILQQNKPDSRVRARDLLEKCLEMLDETKFPGVWAYAQEKMADVTSTFPLPTLFGTQAPAHNPSPFSTGKTSSTPSADMSAATITIDSLQAALHALAKLTEQQLADAESQFVTAVHHLSKGLSALAQLENAPAHKLQVLSMKSKAAYCYLMLAKIFYERRRYGAALHWLQLSSQCVKDLPPTTPQQKLFFGSLCSLCADIYVGISAHVTAETLKSHQDDLDLSGTPSTNTNTASAPLPNPTSPLLVGKTPASETSHSVAISTPPMPKPSFTTPATPPTPTVTSSSPSTTTAPNPTPQIPPSDLVQITEPLSLDVEENLRAAIGYYLRALGLVTTDVDIVEFATITRRLGNAQNQLGIHYMNTSRFTKAAWHFQLAVDTFTQIKDQPNVALIYCNIGKLMKVYAQNERMGLTAAPSTPGSTSSTPTTSVDSGDDPMSEKEQSHYNKAVGFYTSAKEALADRKHHPQIWDVVQSQLASTFLVMGVRTGATESGVQLPQEQGKAASEHLLRALKIFESLKDDYQAAIAHLHLATLYSKMIRSGDNESERRARLKIAVLHFDKALAELTQTKHPKEYLCVKYNLSLMHEQLHAPSHTTRFDNLTKSLLCLLELGDLIVSVGAVSNAPSANEPETSFSKFASQNQTLLRTNDIGQVKAKVEDILKQILKLSSQTNSTTTLQAQVQLFKQLYKDVLSAQSVAALGKVLTNAKASLEKL